MVPSIALPRRSVSETDRPKPLWLAGRVQTFQNSIKFCGVKHRDRLARAIEGTMTLLQDNEKIYPEWRRLVMRKSVRGVQVHDARLAAAMRVHDALFALSFTVCLYAPRLVFNSTNACSIRSSFSRADRRCSISSAAICAFAWLCASACATLRFMRSNAAAWPPLP